MWTGSRVRARAGGGAGRRMGGEDEGREDGVRGARDSGRGARGGGRSEWPRPRAAGRGGAPDPGAAGRGRAPRTRPGWGVGGEGQCTPPAVRDRLPPSRRQRRGGRPGARDGGPRLVSGSARDEARSRRGRHVAPVLCRAERPAGRPPSTSKPPATPAAGARSRTRRGRHARAPRLQRRGGGGDAPRSPFGPKRTERAVGQRQWMCPPPAGPLWTTHLLIYLLYEPGTLYEPGRRRTGAPDLLACMAATGWSSASVPTLRVGRVLRVPRGPGIPNWPWGLTVSGGRTM